MLIPARVAATVHRRRTVPVAAVIPGAPQLVGTRASAATFVDANGVIQSAAINVLRDAHYIGGARTVLLEAAATNLLLSSALIRNITNLFGGATRRAFSNTPHPCPLRSLAKRHTL